MPTSERKRKYDAEYVKEHLKRISLNLQKRKYEELKDAADHAGETVTGYIKKAIDMRIDSEKPKE